MMRAGIPAMLLAIAAVAGTAGCGSAASSGPGSGLASSTASATAVGTASAASGTGAAGSGGMGSGGTAAGVGTPQQVVTGFVQTELAGQWSKLCSYFPPGKRSSCASGAGAMSGKPTGKLTVDGAVIRGKRALVKVTGHICLSGTSDCQSNSDPGLGMPSGSETFTQAYSKAVAGNGFSPIPCIKVKGRWYVNGSA